MQFYLQKSERERDRDAFVAKYHSPMRPDHSGNYPGTAEVTVLILFIVMVLFICNYNFGA